MVARRPLRRQVNEAGASLNITRLRWYFSLSPLRFLMKNLKFEPAKGDPRPSTVRRMIWGVIRLIAVEILAPVAGRGPEQGG